MTEKKKTLGDLTVVELLTSANDELGGLSELVTRVKPFLLEDDARLLGAYVGSTWARTQIALDKIGGNR